MRAQYELTKRFSAESSIRPYIAKDPERTLAVLRRWTRDSNAHVRRLVSEGTRLRLPWAMRVAWLDGHPERVVELLELLKDDPTTLVRRSVANNLNDLGKVHYWGPQSKKKVDCHFDESRTIAAAQMEDWRAAADGSRKATTRAAAVKACGGGDEQLPEHQEGAPQERSPALAAE